MSRFVRYFDEVNIEINADKNKVLSKLKEQIFFRESKKGRCDHSIKVKVYCNDNGFLTVRNYTKNKKGNFKKYGSYFIVGNIIEKNGKTVVKLFSAYEWLKNFCFNIGLIFITLIGICLNLITLLGPFSIWNFYELLSVLFLSSGLFAFVNNNSRIQKSALIEMKNEIIKMVKAVERWYD